MANNELGELRRSAVIMTFGPGSIVDFRANGAPISVVMAGIEEWERSFPLEEEEKYQQWIIEPRLQRKLGVDGFRLPPVVHENMYGKPDKRALVAVRFPKWLQCPQCNRLASAKWWGSEPGQAYRYCPKCTRDAPRSAKIFAIPVRFLMGCENGHLEDFPWHFWVAHKSDCKKKDEADLYLRSKHPGLVGLILTCGECGAQKSMGDIFSAQTWTRLKYKCHGHRPWLGASAKESCGLTPRALQRGASNLYFPVITSALSIPPWTDPLQEAIGGLWNTLVNTSFEDRTEFISTLVNANDALKSVLKELNLAPMELVQKIEDRLKEYEDGATLQIREEEYRLFTDQADIEVPEFEVRLVPVPKVLRPFFSRIARVVRLREVRALCGFTRINPPGNEGNSDIVQLATKKLDWLPAVDVRGEGIFLAFNLETLSKWETQEYIKDREKHVDSVLQKEWSQQYTHEVDENKKSRLPERSDITSCYLLIHTFAHALMRQLTLECGYSLASLRERLYVSKDKYKDKYMAGLLIYTATPDSDGTLGGLQRQGEEKRIEPTVIAAIQAMEWCSCDPLCVQGGIAGPDRLSLASCHACVLAPETSCEKYNRFLDRAMLVGHPDAPEAGFFSPLIRGT